jgi:CHASE3 domain sensor protein
LGVSFFYLRKLNALEKNIERVGHSYQVIIQTNLLEKNLQNAEMSQKGYMLTESPDFLEAYLAEIKNIPEILDKIDKLTSDNRYQQRNLDTLRQMINNQLLILKNNMVNGIADSVQFEDNNVQADAVMRVIKNIKQHETKLLSQRNYTTSENTSDSKRSSFLSLIIAFCLCCVAAVCVLWFFNRNEIYRSELEDKLSKLTILNSEIKGLTIASTHNLQEPMRKVQTIIDRLQHVSGLNDPELTGQLNRIKEIYNKQQSTNNTIIDYYNILSRANEKTKIDLRKFILSLQNDYKWIQHFSLELGELKSIDADPAQLRLLFTHIINNSIQYRSPERELSIQIKESLEPLPFKENKSYYCIAISDNGIGIDETYKDKIFNLFEKIEISALGTKQNGMGLSFCKRIMLNHDGWISARKNQQFGTTIYLYFPFST